MSIPIQVVFHNTAGSEELEALIRDKAAKLGRFADRILSCRVVVDTPHRHHQTGNHYQVRIDLTIPGEEIVVNREPGQHLEHKNLNAALRDAFDAARRQLESRLECRRGYVKTHEPAPHARVTRLVPDQHYGFLRTPDGREIYFHRNSVLNSGFDHLEVGTEVSFAEEAGHGGPQASTVKPVGRHHHA